MRVPAPFGSPGCFPIRETFCDPAATPRFARSSRPNMAHCWFLNVRFQSSRVATRLRWSIATTKSSIRTVTVGDRVGTQWIIADGLNRGERVVAEGVQKVRTGARVNPKPFGTENKDR